MKLIRKYFFICLIFQFFIHQPCFALEFSLSQTYQDNTGEFKITIPADWIVKKNYSGLNFIAISPKESEKDHFYENINIVYEDLKKKITTDDWSIGNLNYMKSFFKDFKIKNKETIQLPNGITAIQVLVDQTVKKEKQSKIYLFFISPKKGYVLTCSALPNTIKDYQEDFNSIIQSLELLPAN